MLVSAHRCNTLEAVQEALGLGVDYVEFDVQVTGGGEFVLAHDPVASAAGHPAYASALATLAHAGGRAHLDLKFEAADEVRAVALAVEALGADALVVTTQRDEGVRRVRDWADATGLDLRVGLSLGRSVTGLPVADRLRVWREDLFPASRFRACGADLVVAHWALAWLTLARFARRRGLPLLVWTVDSDREQAHWLAPGRAWLVTTNRPARALGVRGVAGPSR